MPAELLVGLVLGSACIDDLLEAPYVLGTGLGEPLAMSPTARESLLVAGPTGVHEVDGSGRARLVWTGSARQAVGHRSYTAVLTEDELLFGQLPPDGPLEITLRLPLAGIQDAQAWCEDQLLLLQGQELLLVRPGDAAPRRWAAAGAGAVDLSLAPAPACAEALVLSSTRLDAVSPAGRRLVADGLEQARAVGLDRTGQPWVVQGDPPVLARVQGGSVQTIARHLGSVQDLHFGTGGLLHPDNAYLLTEQGTVDYVRVPQAEPPP